MDLSFIWQSFLLILAGILLLRISGSKSQSQMTLAQTVVMISIGTIIVTEEKIKEITLNAYNQQKSDKVNYKNIKIFIIQPFGQTNKIIEIPLQ